MPEDMRKGVGAQAPLVISENYFLPQCRELRSLVPELQNHVQWYVHVVLPMNFWLAALPEGDVPCVPLRLTPGAVRRAPSIP